jgi:hypothetical protein
MLLTFTIDPASLDETGSAKLFEFPPGSWVVKDFGTWMGPDMQHHGFVEYEAAGPSEHYGVGLVTPPAGASSSSAP